MLSISFRKFRDEKKKTACLHQLLASSLRQHFVFVLFFYRVIGARISFGWALSVRKGTETVARTTCFVPEIFSRTRILSSRLNTQLKTESAKIVDLAINN